MDRLEAELHAERAVVGVGQADEEVADGRESILAYVRDRPGIPSREVVLYGRGPLTHSGAKRVITELLLTGQLRSDRPEERAFGGAHQRLYPA
jgi:hypothetical protein